jgi:transposase
MSRRRRARRCSSPQFRPPCCLLIRRELDPVWWTSSERRIRWPEWDQARRDDGRGGGSPRSSWPARSGSYWMRARRSGRSPGDLDLTPSSLANWVKHARADRTEGKTGLTTTEREELARLRKENRILHEERDILKKALPVSARHAQWLLRLAAPSGIDACP